MSLVPCCVPVTGVKRDSLALASAREQASAPSSVPLLQVLRLVAAGKSNREIAATLVISDHTVRRHLQNIFAKLGVSSRADATAFAFQHDLI